MAASYEIIEQVGNVAKVSYTGAAGKGFRYVGDRSGEGKATKSAFTAAKGGVARNEQADRDESGRFQEEDEDEDVVDGPTQIRYRVILSWRIEEGTDSPAFVEVRAYDHFTANVDMDAAGFSPLEKLKVVPDSVLQGLVDEIRTGANAAVDMGFGFHPNAPSGRLVPDTPEGIHNHPNMSYAIRKSGGLGSDGELLIYNGKREFKYDIERTPSAGQVGQGFSIRRP